MSPMIVIVEGDLKNQLWSYNHGKLSTPGGLWFQSVKLPKELRRLRRLPDTEAAPFIEKARVEQIYEAAGGIYGPIGMLVGAAIGKRVAKAQEAICFRAELKDGRSFTAVAFADVFADIQAVTGIAAETSTL